MSLRSGRGLGRCLFCKSDRCCKLSYTSRSFCRRFACPHRRRCNRFAPLGRRMYPLCSFYRPDKGFRKFRSGRCLIAYLHTSLRNRSLRCRNWTHKLLRCIFLRWRRLSHKPRSALGCFANQHKNPSNRFRRQYSLRYNCLTNIRPHLCKHSHTFRNGICRFEGLRKHRCTQSVRLDNRSCIRP